MSAIHLRLEGHEHPIRVSLTAWQRTHVDHAAIAAELPLAKWAVGRLQAAARVRGVRGSETDPNLPRGQDAVLIVNAYHEMDDPVRPQDIVTLLRHVAEALKPQGRLGVVDFTPGDGGPGPAANERADAEAIIRAASAAGLKLLRRETVPPYQFLLVFGRDPAASRSAQ